MLIYIQVHVDDDEVLTELNEVEDHHPQIYQTQARFEDPLIQPPPKTLFTPTKLTPTRGIYTPPFKKRERNLKQDVELVEEKKLEGKETSDNDKEEESGKKREYLVERRASLK